MLQEKKELSLMNCSRIRYFIIPCYKSNGPITRRTRGPLKIRVSQGVELTQQSHYFFCFNSKCFSFSMS